MSRSPGDWHLWQWSADGNNMGDEFGVHSHAVDLNVFNGTVVDMADWLGMTLDEPAPPVVVEPPLDCREAYELGHGDGMEAIAVYILDKLTALIEEITAKFTS